MTPILPRILVALALTMALLATALPHPTLARGEESLLWTTRTSDGLASLSYGTLDPAEIPLFMLSCFDGMNIAVLNLHKELNGTKPGQKITIELSAGPTQSPVQGEAARNGRDGPLFAEASGIAVAPVLDVLRESGPVTVSVGETRETMSDAGRAKAVAQFSKDCRVE